MKTSVLKPGYLVSLKTSLRGGIAYRRQDIEREHTDAAGALVCSWTTEREIPDPEEFSAATVARGAARSAVAGICSASAFGLLCPTAREGELYQAIETARQIADEHNNQAKRTRVEVYVLVGRIAQDDAEAARAIASEIRELLDAMREGVKAADPAAIREAANKARALGQMLSEEVSGKVSEAIKEARTIARQIVKQTADAGEGAARELAKMYPTGKIEGARFAFLDLDEGESAPQQAAAGRVVDMEPAGELDSATPPAARDVDFSEPEKLAAAGPTDKRNYALEF